MAFTDYTVGGSGSGGTTPGDDQGETEYWSHAKLKRAYVDYLSNKREEIEEQQDARRYRHGVHWTAAQIKVLNDRKQPVVTYNRIGRKIDAVIGLVEKLRQDPKAYPRTPKHEQGAELATASLRYALDQQEWKAKSPICAESGAVDGIGGLEIELIEGDQGDREVGLQLVDPDGFFYDPRSFRADFSDARYMGVGKWVDADTAKELIPDKDDEIDAATDRGDELSSNADRDSKWFQSTGDRKSIRLVDLWYRQKGKWCWSIFTGSSVLMEGVSWLIDEKKKTACKYIMYSAAVDQDGDRYGFPRNLKSANDEINQRRSKGLHELNTRRIIGEIGAFDDIEKARKEIARPDGMVLRNKGYEAEFDDTAKMAHVQGQLQFLQDAKEEIENFGPNPALLGKGGVENSSGRAIKLLQEAGIAELGPYILAYRGWKLRVYRAVWNAIQRNWTGERWVRVTDDDGIAQFIQINGVGIDPQTGMPTIVNAIGSLDVDIILDEGPDQINVMADVYETLSAVIPSIASLLTPQEARAAVQLLVSTSALPSSAKKQFKDASQQGQQPDPMAEQAKQVALAGETAKVDETKSKTMLNMAKAQQAGTPEMSGQSQPQEFELPPEVQVGQAMAEIDETQASAEHKRAQAAKVHAERSIVPARFDQDVFEDGADRQERVAFKNADIRDSAENRKSAARRPAAQ